MRISNVLISLFILSTIVIPLMGYYHLILHDFALGIIPISIFCYLMFHFVVGFLLVFQLGVETKKGLLHFFICLVILFIALKIQYVFYNVFGHLAILIIGFVLSFKFKILDHKLSVLLRNYLLISLLFCFIPNKKVLDFIYLSEIPYPKVLTWEDFQGEPAEEKEFTASIHSRIRIKINRAFNYPPAVSGAYMIPEKSWVKNKNKREFPVLLSHEQFHFENIARVHEFLVDSINSLWGKDYDHLKKVYNYHEHMEHKLDSIYDSFTDHGAIVEKQKAWESYSREQLVRIISEEY